MSFPAKRSSAVADLWLTNPARSQYLGGVTFDPTRQAPPNYMNLWRGFAVDPAPGNWSLMRDHIARVICCSDDQHFEYLMNWAALMFQQPGRQGEVAVVIRGKKGCGKGIFFHCLRKAWGQHGVYISNAKHLTGNFNAHLRDCVFLFADEAFFAGDRQHESILKGLVTDPVLPIEGKHQNLVIVRNMLHIGMAANSDWLIPASRDERRYFMKNASDHRVGQLAYFADIAAQMENGGLAAMIWDLLHRDISRFNVRDVPDTDALAEQKKHSLDSLDRWWLACLERGFVWRSQHGLKEFDQWHEFLSTELLTRSYLQWCADNRVSRPMSRVELGLRMTEIYRPKRPEGEHIIGEIEDATPGFLERSLLVSQSRPHGYQVDTLEEARARFSEMRGIGGEWSTL